MAENAYQVLKSTSPALVAVLDTNLDVCDFLIAVYKHIQDRTNASSLDPKDLKCSVDITRERLLVVRTWYENASAKSGAAQSSLPMHRNQNISDLMNENSSIRDVAKGVVEILERWIQEKPERKQQGFRNIKLVNGVCWKDGTFTIEMVLKFEFEEMVRAQMGFGVDESPEQPTEEDIEEMKKAIEDAPDLEYKRKVN